MISAGSRPKVKKLVSILTRPQAHLTAKLTLYPLSLVTPRIVYALLNPYKKSMTNIAKVNGENLANNPATPDSALVASLDIIVSPNFLPIFSITSFTAVEVIVLLVIIVAYFAILETILEPAISLNIFLMPDNIPLLTAAPATSSAEFAATFAALDARYFPTYSEPLSAALSDAYFPA